VTTRPKIGFALSGGAVRGAAHIGALRVLERADLRPDFIAGTSIGAIIGSAYAAGHSTEELERRFSDLDWFSLVRPTLKLKQSLVDTGRLGKFLSTTLRLTTFEALQIPFAAVTCDLQSGDRVTLTRGDLVQAVRASSALPGIFPPEEIDGRMLVDGGVVQNLPAAAVREMGAEFVIGVDLLPAGGSSRRPDNLFEIWHRSVYLMVRANHPACNDSCHTITPQIAELSFTDFREVPELVRRGEEAAREALPEIVRSLGTTPSKPASR
jgi:NTE family protein